MIVLDIFESGHDLSQQNLDFDFNETLLPHGGDTFIYHLHQM